MTNDEYRHRLHEDLQRYYRLLEYLAENLHISRHTAFSHKNHARTFERFVEGTYPPPEKKR